MVKLYCITCQSWVNCPKQKVCITTLKNGKKHRGWVWALKCDDCPNCRKTVYTIISDNKQEKLEKKGINLCTVY